MTDDVPSTPPRSRSLVVIAGPIGAGKSTIAALTGRLVAGAGRAVAVVDLDDVTFMQLGHVDPFTFWRRGAFGTAALVRAWFDEGVEVVVAHGPFFESDGYDLLLSAQPADVEARHVLLRVTYAVALERVAVDPSRRVSKNPDFLRATHDRFPEIERSLPRPHDVFDTTVLSAEAVATEIATALVRR